MSNTVRIKAPKTGKTVDGQVIKVVKADEPFSCITLEDGTEISMRTTVIQVVRHKNQWDEYGNPIYTIDANGTITVNAAEESNRGKKPMKYLNAQFTVTGDKYYLLSNDFTTDNPNLKQPIHWDQPIVRQNSKNYVNVPIRFTETSLQQKLNLEQQNECKRTIQKFLNCYGERNWDGENADPVTPESVSAALRVVEELPSDVEAPELSVDPEGNIEFDWHLDNGTMFTISVGSTGDVAISGLYLGEAKLTGMEEDSNGNPLTLLRCGLEWLIEMQKR